MCNGLHNFPESRCHSEAAKYVLVQTKYWICLFKFWKVSECVTSYLLVRHRHLIWAVSHCRHEVLSSHCYYPLCHIGKGFISQSCSFLKNTPNYSSSSTQCLYSDSNPTVMSHKECVCLTLSPFGRPPDWLTLSQKADIKYLFYQEASPLGAVVNLTPRAYRMISVTNPKIYTHGFHTLAKTRN